MGSKNPLTAIGLDYGDHGAAHVPSPLGALESSFADVSRVCDVWPCAILRAVGAGDGRGRRAAPLFAKRLRSLRFVLKRRAERTPEVFTHGKNIGVRAASLSPDAPESTRSRARSAAGTFRCPASVR